MYVGCTVKLSSPTPTSYLLLFHRDFLVKVGSEKARSSNMNCEVITEVKHDRSDSVIDITFGE